MTNPIRAWYAGLTDAESNVAWSVGVLFVLFVLGVASGVINLSYGLYLLALAGMYVLLSLGLNVHWGYAGLIDFSVAAFWGLGAYGTALVSARDSPLGFTVDPIVGLVVGLALAAAVAVIIGIPTLRLRSDYLAIATLGLAEVIRSVINNQSTWTNGPSGILGLPLFFGTWPILGDVPRGAPTYALDVCLVAVFVGVTYWALRRLHLSPWGRTVRTIRADEDLAEALGKNAFRFKMEAFVVGCVVMALAGVFYAHLQLAITPGALDPTQTFYVWIAVILGGSGSNRGAFFGGLVLVLIVQGTRFLGGVLPSNFPSAAVRLLVIGVLIIAVMYARQEGVLPAQHELITPGTTEGNDE
ncbi:branched-chain amino acid transport system permease protein LivM [Halarchaeum acidiphilum MH1-52-1]|uniref:Branched-chain amino acid transport system permease protein LivM n=1 Tax=Halarchaeum acidiphilum MH1-52-1 TaxID=1261545 RepID=U3A1D2_9EURY|nr:branched-chain amino acid ABC transporter permease [Halarchaeum acidiphilum]GAD51444.1 branched-chain amino acid transport system permease protein LivM [Halarchaeum acidiphilum MH1-52-1]